MSIDEQAAVTFSARVSIPLGNYEAALHYIEPRARGIEPVARLARGFADAHAHITTWGRNTPSGSFIDALDDWLEANARPTDLYY